MLFSPANQAATPPSFGITFAISAKALPAFAAATTASGSIPATLSENVFSDEPKDAISFPKLAILFSPANQAVTPPSFGIIFAISAKALQLKTNRYLLHYLKTPSKIYRKQQVLHQI